MRPYTTSTGRVCRGDYSMPSAALSLSFRDNAGFLTNATYRVVDANSESNGEDTEQRSASQVYRVPQVEVAVGLSVIH